MKKNIIELGERYYLFNRTAFKKLLKEKANQKKTKQNYQIEALAHILSRETKTIENWIYMGKNGDKGNGCGNDITDINKMADFFGVQPFDLLAEIKKEEEVKEDINKQSELDFSLIVEDDEHQKNNIPKENLIIKGARFLAHNEKLVFCICAVISFVLIMGFIFGMSLPYCVMFLSSVGVIGALYKLSKTTIFKFGNRYVDFAFSLVYRGAIIAMGITAFLIFIFTSFSSVCSI